MPQREYRVVEVVETWADGNQVGRFNIRELAGHAQRLHEQSTLADEQAKEQSRRICEALAVLKELASPSSVIESVIAILEGRE